MKSPIILIILFVLFVLVFTIIYNNPISRFKPSRVDIVPDKAAIKHVQRTYHDIDHVGHNKNVKFHDYVEEAFYDIDSGRITKYVGGKLSVN